MTFQVFSCTLLRVLEFVRCKPLSTKVRTHEVEKEYVSLIGLPEKHKPESRKMSEWNTV
jgi:hypothetical protein